MKKTIIVGLFIFWTAFIFYNSFQVGSTSSQVSGRYVQILVQILSRLNINVENINLSLIIRKAAHITEFFILAVLSYLVLINYTLRNKYRPIINIVIVVFVASIDEGIQLFVEGRNGSIIDVGIDTIGILIATFVMLFITRRKYSNIVNNLEYIE